MENNQQGWFRRLMHTRVGGLLLPIASSTSEGDKNTQALMRHLLREAQRQEAWDAPLERTRFVVMDTETTGFHTQEDIVLSIGAVVMTGGQIHTGETFYSLVNSDPSHPIPPAITELTGIRAEDVRKAPTPREVLPSFLQFAKDAVLVLHHAGHDLPFLNQLLRRTFRTQLTHRVLDTADIARWLHPECSGGLDELLVRYGIPVQDRHHALGDARMTAQLWQVLMAEVFEHDVQSLGDLYETMILSK